MKTKTNKAATKITLHTETETLFIISPCYWPEQFLIVWTAQKHTFDFNSIIHVAGVVVNEKRAQMGPEIRKKHRIFIFFGVAFL